MMTHQDPNQARFSEGSRRSARVAPGSHALRHTESDEYYTPREIMTSAVHAAGNLALAAVLDGAESLSGWVQERHLSLRGAMDRQLNSNEKSVRTSQVRLYAAMKGESLSVGDVMRRLVAGIGHKALGSVYHASVAVGRRHTDIHNALKPVNKELIASLNASRKTYWQIATGVTPRRKNKRS